MRASEKELLAKMIELERELVKEDALSVETRLHDVQQPRDSDGDAKPDYLDLDDDENGIVMLRELGAAATQPDVARDAHFTGSGDGCTLGSFARSPKLLRAGPRQDERNHATAGCSDQADEGDPRRAPGHGSSSRRVRARIPRTPGGSAAEGATRKAPRAPFASCL